VNVDIRHSGRGELRVQLIAPDGTVVRLVETSAERAPDLVTTFGRDSIPVDSLDQLRGRSAAGEWRLRVIDLAFGDVATVVSWGLLVRFQGEAPSATRPVAARRQVVPVAGHAPGANGTFFTTDLQLLNPASRAVEVLLIFTPSAADGRTNFAAVRVVLGGGESATFRDVIRTLFATAGLGSIDIAGDVIASTRTSTRGHGGTYGLFAPAAPVADSIGSNSPPLSIAHLRNDDAFRSNVGFVEVTGHPVRAVVDFGGGDARSYDVPPFGHLQVPVETKGTVLAPSVSVEGEGRLIAYGAVVDNRSGDPVFILARAAPMPPGAVVPAISSAGAAGTFWRTDVASTTGSELTYRTAAGFVTRLVPAGSRIDDIVGQLFDGEGTIGVIENGSASLVSVRIWTDGPNGTYGLSAPFGVPSNAQEQHILHVETSADFRTNIGLIAGENGATVRVTVLDGDGNPVAVSGHVVPPRQLVQFAIVEGVLGGRVRVDVLEGAVYAYGALVDNRTGDPIFVPAMGPP
ncbi:MAG TPA: proprotein convertase P-domain-containing protein, partial [Thermoanaerobaculia bacterium]|nr:proprotein convertase P-domain-containing protein [Thermoanaerobaculia bacterium]